MFGKSSGKTIGAMVVQTRAAPTLSGASGLIWSDGAARDAPAHANAAGRVPGIAIEGKVSGDADISVNGRIKGDVDVTSLTVDEAGVIEGRITAEQVEVRGRVVGDIHAAVIKLHPQACVHGDLSYGQLSIELGAEFQGACRQLPKPAPVEAAAAEVEFAVPPAPPMAEDETSTEMAPLPVGKPDLAGVPLPEKGEGLLN